MSSTSSGLELALTSKEFQYFRARYKDALKGAFFELQASRDEYQLAAKDFAMHKELIYQFIELQALLILPIAPHFAEHLWRVFLKNTTSIQTAHYPAPSCPVDQAALDAINYVRALLNTVRGSEASFAKKKAKGKSSAGFDVSKPKAVRMFLSQKFPEWQTACINAMQNSYDSSSQGIDITKVKEALGSKGLLKEKRAMPFCMTFAVS